MLAGLSLDYRFRLLAALEIIECDTLGCQIDLNGSGGWAGNVRTSQNVREIQQTSSLGQREDHEKYSAVVSAAIKNP